MRIFDKTKEDHSTPIFVEPIVVHLYLETAFLIRDSCGNLTNNRYANSVAFNSDEEYQNWLKTFNHKTNTTNNEH